MTDQQIIISSLAMDLKRAALGFHHGSHATAKRFLVESSKRLSEIDKESVSLSFQKIISAIRGLCDKEVTDRTAEDLLMYSTLCQNQVLNKL